MATAARSQPGRPSEPEPAPPPYETVGDIAAKWPDLPIARVRLNPTPGTATERDLIRVNGRKQGLYELLDGVLVRKPMVFEDSVLEVRLALSVGNFVIPRNLGVLFLTNRPFRVAPGQVRLPDIAFVTRAKFRRRRRGEAISRLVPDLAVEVLSRSNTKREMDRKLREFLAAGTRLVWHVDPRKRTVRVFTEPGRSTLLGAGDTLDGGDVLPGFTLPLRELFAELDR